MVGVPIVSHVLPSLALIRELVDRGHQVTYANDPFVADRIECTGAELVPCTSTLPVDDNDWPADPIAAASLFLDDAVQALPQLRAAYDDDPADLTEQGLTTPAGERNVKAHTTAPPPIPPPTASIASSARSATPSRRPRLLPVPGARRTPPRSAPQACPARRPPL